MSWFSYKKIKLKAHISPSFLGNITEGFKLQLRSKLFRWIPEVSGILLGWKKLRILECTGTVLGDLVPLLQIPISIKALIWSPKEGGIVRGNLAHMGYDYMAIHVLGIWNAAIPSKRFASSLDCSAIKEGAVIQFRIHRYVSAR
ncbi:uncharacterized protein LOC126315270 isoform X1 [Schistocerca gregaria]|uniref:uncharacterized protein LOC126315270 isoform X1 n=1 Tax=Schistocerca gregaria TaxID=7010 RepID=UPI00211F1444|nr:uncharacterized protein LOC126315270 isoform X1 [Schistocerca gregaria]